MKVQRLMVVALLAVGGMACAQETADKGGFYVGVGGHYVNMRLTLENTGAKVEQSDNVGGAAVSVFGGYSEKCSSGILLGLEGHCSNSFVEKEVNYAAQKVTYSFSFPAPSMAFVIGYDTSFGSICLTAGAATFKNEANVKLVGSKGASWGVAPEFGAFYEYRILKNLGIRVGGSYAFDACFSFSENAAGKTTLSADRLCLSACAVYHF
ncbi:MAG: hypothetical protein LBJ70_02170 [Holosporales bacterium]|nr:hypothetical protein [Holosporales bacterium]